MEQSDAKTRLLVATHHLPIVAICHNLKYKSKTYPSLPRSIAKKIGAKPSVSPLTPFWELQQRAGHTALFSGIKSLGERMDVLHVGWTGQIVDESKEPIHDDIDPILMDDLVEKLGPKFVPIILDDETAKGHYESYCKGHLWPIFHYQIWEKVTKDTPSWVQYIKVNQAFADAIVKIWQPEDLIWIHDYHLMLLPSLLRKALPKAKIGFFLHTPFPSSELFRCLPKRKEILSGILGANLIGFQTYSHARHFISSCTRVLGLESSPKGVDFHGHVVQIGIFSAGIDAERSFEKRKESAVIEKIQYFKNLYAGKNIIFGREPLDQIKGIRHKLAAFEKFLTMFPEHRSKVIMIQITTPCQAENGAKLESQVSELVSRINGAYGSLDFSPVHYYHHEIDLTDYFALLSVADIGLITSTRDGMNTSSHEFVLCQAENRGTLIISEFTGTAGSLSNAILVNPWDYVGVATAIQEALSFSMEDRIRKHQSLYEHVVSHSSAYWANSFINAMFEASLVETHSTPTPVLDLPLLKSSYAKSKKRLFLFDYDGTLTAIRKTPNAAVPSKEMLLALTALVNNQHNWVYIVSGRDQAFLEMHLGHIVGLGLR
jgi:trehalose 6-phosphate synthase/phosphatase